MDDIKRMDIVDIELNSGSIHRGWLNHSIGTGDAKANSFGVRVFRDKAPVSLTGGSVQGFFRNSQGQNIALTSEGTIDGNVAYVTLPQACYNYEGQFTLAIKLINAGDGVTGTMRIVDGMVDNTHTGSAIAPTEDVPTYQEVLAVYADMQECLEDFDDYKDGIDAKVSDVRTETGIPLVSFIEVTGKYIFQNQEKTSANFNHSVPIAVNKGDIVSFTATGYLALITMIALSNQDGTSFVSVVNSTDSNEHTYEYTVLEDGYIVVSYNKSYPKTLILKTNLSNTSLNNRVQNMYNANVIELADDSGINATSGSVNMSATGKYITNTGALADSANFNMSSSISLVAGQTIKFNAKGYLTSVSILAKDNGNNTYTPLIVSEDSDEHIFTYYAPKNINVVISSYKTVNPQYVIYSSRIDSNELRIKALEDGSLDFKVLDANFAYIADNVAANMSDTGHFIRADGVRAELSNFNISSSISLDAGKTIVFNAIGYQTNVAVLSRANGDGTYTPLVISNGDNEGSFSYFSDSEINVVICSKNTLLPQYSIFSSRIDSNELRIKALENNCFAFTTLGVIGDSLATGATNYANAAADRPNYSWGKCIQREHGIDVNLFSKGGADTRLWLSSSWGLAALNAADILDCYAIGLGVNDAHSLGDDYLGSASDIHVGSEDQNGDTYYGNYSRIIAAIKTKSPRAKIFCLTNPKDNTQTKKDFNDAVRDIVEMYTNTYLIDLAADSFYTSVEFNSTWNVAHSTAVGYRLIAENIYGHINKIIRGNLSDFLDIQWIIENHP